MSTSSAIRSMASQHKTMTILRCKVVIVGDAKVGKSALTQMFHSGGHAFPKNYVMTIGVDFCVKVVTIPDTNTQVELYMHDSAGQSIFNQQQHGTVHWEGVSMVMVVFDVSNRESFQSCDKWLQLVRGMRPSGPVPGVLVANKIDLNSQGRGQVTREEAMAFAEQRGLTYFETSAAQNGNDVDAPFNFLADAFYRRYEEHLQRCQQAVIAE